MKHEEIERAMQMLNDGVKIKDGLQEHALMMMDGRIWIEVVFPPRTPLEARVREHKLKMGYIKMIPHNALVHLVHQTVEHPAILELKKQQGGSSE